MKAKNKIISLKELTQEMGINKYLIENKIGWSFIPPRSPHFGGLWEAGVKSTKFHLKRILGKTHLDFENYATALCQIEAILNSRPMYPLSDDPNDHDPLTPRHFLLGGPLTALVENDLSSMVTHSLNMCQRLQQMVQQFWTRCKAPDAVVLLIEHNTPSQRWVMGRIVKMYSSDVGEIRVVESIQKIEFLDVR